MLNTHWARAPGIMTRRCVAILIYPRYVGSGRETGLKCTEPGASLWKMILNLSAHISKRVDSGFPKLNTSSKDLLPINSCEAEKKILSLTNNREPNPINTCRKMEWSFFSLSRQWHVKVIVRGRGKEQEGERGVCRCLRPWPWRSTGGKQRSEL